MKAVFSGRGGGDSSERHLPRSGAALTSAGVRGIFFSARQAWKTKAHRAKFGLFAGAWTLRTQIPASTPRFFLPSYYLSRQHRPSSAQAQQASSLAAGIHPRVGSSLAFTINGFTPQTAGMRANQSLNLSRNGKPAGPGPGSSAHFPVPGPAVLPSRPG